MTLPGGERQRKAIARAKIKDAPVVILDEPTTGLDVESEDLVLRGLDELTRSRTAFVITHRLSTIIDADRIYVVEDGRIVEHGTHQDLLELGGRYSQLHQIQTRTAIRVLPERDATRRGEASV